MEPPSQPPAGYYPDPGGSSALRYWDGGQWTATLAEVPARPSPAPSLTYQSTSVLPARSVPTAARGRPWWLAAVAVLAFIAVALGSVVVVSHRAHPTSVTPPSRYAGTRVHGGGQQPQPVRHVGKPVINSFIAIHVVDEFWHKHERAYGSNDIAALRRLDDGALEFYDIGIATCLCQHQRPRPLLEARYFMPWQTTYPAYFASQIRTRAAGQSQAEIYVFEKRSKDAPWVAIEDSGFAAPMGQVTGLGTPDTQAFMYDKRPAPAAHHAHRTSHSASRGSGQASSRPDGCRCTPASS